MKYIHKGQTDLELQGNCGIDISAATVKQIDYKKPDGTTGSWGADFVTDGTDGLLKYKITSSSELDQTGDWQIQGYVESPSGVIAGEINIMTVSKKIIQ